MMGWVDAWNTIIRKVIFKDTELKRLMGIPSKTNIIQFADRYFVKAGYTSKLLTDEVCRVIYADTQVGETNVPNVTTNLLTFDIYVRADELRNASNDGLVMRTQLIAARLERLMMQDEYVAETGYRFRLAGEWDRGTRTNGYARYAIGFYYKRVY